MTTKHDTFHDTTLHDATLRDTTLHDEIPAQLVMTQCNAKNTFHHTLKRTVDIN
jgi:hypothetical protein